MLLKKEGGFYVDLDMACLRSLDQLVQDAEIILTFDILRRITCSITASAPEHPFSETSEASLLESMDQPVLWATGPDFYQNITPPVKRLPNLSTGNSSNRWAGRIPGSRRISAWKSNLPVNLNGS